MLGYEALGRCDPKARDKAFMRKKHDCWVDCDSPSECCHRRYELAAEAIRIAQKQAKEAQTLMSRFLPVNVTTETWEESTTATTRGAAYGEEEEVSPKSPLRQSSFLWDDEDEVDNGGDDKMEGEGGENKENEEMFEVEDREEEEEMSGFDMSRPTTPCPGERSSSSSTPSSTAWKIPGLDYSHWEDAMNDNDYSQDRSGSTVKCWTVQSLNSDDTAHAGSDSDSESDSSGWSTESEESDDSGGLVVETGMLI